MDKKIEQDNLQNIVNIELEQFAIELFKSSSLLSDLIKNVCQEYGISNVQLYIIMITSYQKMNVSMIAKILNITKSAISQALTGLLIHRIVTKKPSKDDRKIFYIIPTPKGITIRSKVLTTFEVQYNLLKEKMGSDDLNNLINLLIKFNTVLEKFKTNKEETGC